MRGAAGSETGRRYRANFDVAHLITDPLLAVVADGMGDSEGSALASRSTVDTVVSSLSGEVGPAAIRSAVATAHRRVREIGQGDVGLAGCTLTLLAEGADGLWIGQVGDSRVYRLRGGLLELLTVDHTMAWLGVNHGAYAFDSPQARSARYHLTRYVGHPETPDPDVLHVLPRAGDVYLLCTDGVADQVSYPAMHAALSLGGDPSSSVAELLAAAGAAGGHDNATAVVVTVL